MAESRNSSCLKRIGLTSVVLACCALQSPMAVAQSAGNKATPVDRIKAAKGFHVELLYSVPADKQGSWVALCVDDKGRFYASDQYGGLYRFPAPAPGQPLDPETVEKVPADIRGVNGMHFADGALYVGVNDYEKKIPSGFYKLTDSDDDNRLDKVELLREMGTVKGHRSGGDHGLHGVVPVPGSDDFYLICGNRVAPTEADPASPFPVIWGEDHLLPRMPDGVGHNRNVRAPGGMIYRVSRDGKSFSLVSVGFRNIYDAAVNHAGELFTYDSDMELDMNTPWYRPTRVNHVVSGGEFGWRNGGGKRPEFYADNLPGTVNVGPGSPTGMTFGYGAKFPAKYQKALFILDWSWGKIYTVYLEPKGASYTGMKEDFLSGAPLPVTDVVIHPQDGAMYFTIGGRRVQSGLYRVTYVGDESTEPVVKRGVSFQLADNHAMQAGSLRHSLEAFHGKRDPKAIEAAWPHLSHPDRHIRWAARTAIEHQPIDTWEARALAETDPARQIESLLALSRVGGTCPYHRIPPRPLGAAAGKPIEAEPLPEGAAPTPPADTALRDEILEALIAIDFDTLSPDSQRALVRTVQVTLNRFDCADEAMTKKLLADLDPAFPAKSFSLNWLLCETLAYLQSPTVAEKAIALIEAAPTQEEQVQYARSIRILKAGWTNELHTAYFEWFLKAANYRGGGSFEKFIQFIRDDAVASLSESQKESLKEILAKKPVKKSALENLGAIFAGRTETKWTLDELSQAARTELKYRDFANGRRMFAAGGCFACHRFGDLGGITGPDLTSAGRRYSVHDLLDQVINPSKVINDQFSAVMVVTEDGRVHTGVVVNLSGTKFTLNTDLSDPNQRVNIDPKTIEEIMVSKTSPMPAGLFNRMTKDEILDLIAYLISGGDSQHDYFRK